jgi:hypothetical protein
MSKWCIFNTYCLGKAKAPRLVLMRCVTSREVVIVDRSYYCLLRWASSPRSKRLCRNSNVSYRQSTLWVIKAILHPSIHSSAKHVSSQVSSAYPWEKAHPLKEWWGKQVPEEIVKNKTIKQWPKKGIWVGPLLACRALVSHRSSLSHSHT